jgi:hypothetical protein
MQSYLPAGDSRAIVFATTADGLRLPVIDVTHPAFAVADDPASLAARCDAFLAWDRRNRRMPRIVTQLLIRLAARRSLLLRKILAPDNEYLDSISTYMLKLGADHLPSGFDGPVDRKVAAAPHMALVRLRMQQIARLLAEALLAPLGDAPDAPLHLVNIAGGPALDSINALIMLARAHATLIHRPIAIHVLDAQQDGPTFGARTVLALTAPGGPLNGLDVQFQHHAYDWNDTAPLVPEKVVGPSHSVPSTSDGYRVEIREDRDAVTPERDSPLSYWPAHKLGSPGLDFVAYIGACVGVAKDQ